MTAIGRNRILGVVLNHAERSGESYGHDAYYQSYYYSPKRQPRLK